MRKTTLWVVMSIFALLGCGGAFAADAPKQQEIMSDFTIPIVDTAGKPVKRGTPCVAQRLSEDYKLVIYMNTPADIDLLIAELKKAGINDKELLEPDHWKRGPCNTRAAWECGSGTGCDGRHYCRQCSEGGTTVCRCWSR